MRKLFLAISLLAILIGLSGCDSSSEVTILQNHELGGYCFYSDDKDQIFDFVPDQYLFQVTGLHTKEGKSEPSEVTVSSMDGSVEKTIDISKAMKDCEAFQIQGPWIYGRNIDGQIYLEIPLTKKTSAEGARLLIRIDDLKTQIVRLDELPNYAPSDENIKIVKSTDLLREYGFTWTRIYNCQRFPDYSLIIVPVEELENCNLKRVYDIFPELQKMERKEEGIFYFYFSRMDDSFAIDFLIGIDKVDFSRVKPKKDGIYGTYFDQGEYHDIDETEWQSIICDILQSNEEE